MSQVIYILVIVLSLRYFLLLVKIYCSKMVRFSIIPQNSYICSDANYINYINISVYLYLISLHHNKVLLVKGTFQL